MEPNPYESPREAAKRLRRRPRQDVIDRLIRWLPMPVKVALLVLFVIVLTVLIVPAVQSAREHQEMREMESKYTRDKDGYLVPK